MSTPAKRSEILFCYDVRMANPNGDPDENRPRIDHVTRRNLVTDFRLKRTIRDYLQQNNHPIFIRAEADEAGNLKQIEDLAGVYIRDDTVNTIKVKGKNVPRKVVDRQALIRDHIDIRLFGLLFAVNIENQNISFKQIGPVQFAIGQSLHPVEEVTIRMTRVVPTRAEVQAGTMGEKSVLRYSFLAFRGFVNDVVAKEVGLTEEDINLMLQALWYGTNNLSTTSKYGQQSRILLRVVYKKPNTYIGDFDKFVQIDAGSIDSSKLEDITQLKLNVTRLLNTLGENRGLLDSIQYASNDKLACVYEPKEGDMSVLLTEWSKQTGITIQNILQG